MARARMDHGGRAGRFDKGLGTKARLGRGRRPHLRILEQALAYLIHPLLARAYARRVFRPDAERRLLLLLLIGHHGSSLQRPASRRTNDQAKHLFRFKNIAAQQSDEGRFAPLRRRNKSSMRLLARAKYK